jgi:CMP-N-acetylneuraminic acid synthetase
MIAGLIVGKHKSLGCPGKHLKKILGRPLVEYPFLAAKNSKKIQKLFVSTDSPDIKEIGEKYGAITIDRPPELAMPDSILEDTLVHAYEKMCFIVNGPIEIVALIFGNAPMLLASKIDESIEILQKKRDYDSAFTVAKYNMFSPARAHKVSPEGEIQHFTDISTLGDISSIRDSQGDCYFCDLQIQIMRDTCFKNMEEGRLPYKWMGKKTYALMGGFGFDIDYEWQFAVAEYWLKANGFSHEETPYDEEVCLLKDKACTRRVHEK